MNTRLAVMRDVALVAVVCFIIDRISKIWIIGEMEAAGTGFIPVNSVLSFRMAWNTGVNFGFMSGIGPHLLIGVAVIISGFLIVWASRVGRRWFSLAVGLVVGGAIGNAWDRYEYGAVADFLNVTCCGIVNPFSFNVADCAIFAGAFAVIMLGTGSEEAKQEAS